MRYCGSSSSEFQNTTLSALTWGINYLGGNLRYTVVELGFWFLMTPVMAWWAEEFPLERPALVKNVAVLLLLNVATELLYSSYRVKLHHFVYPDFALHSFWGQSQTYLIDNSVIVAWFFWAIVGIHHAIKAARKSQQREQELVKAQLEMLKGQLQPHFLFNTLNSISWLMREDVEAADNMLTSLAELLRTTLSVSASEEVPLRRELNMLELYLAIERARFQDRLTVLVNADPETLDCNVPCLLLQPIVENAVRHGICPARSTGLRGGSSSVRGHRAIHIDSGRWSRNINGVHLEGGHRIGQYAGAPGKALRRDAVFAVHQPERRWTDCGDSSSAAAAHSGRREWRWESFT